MLDANELGGIVGTATAINGLWNQIKKKSQRPHTVPTEGVIDEMGTVWKQHIVHLHGRTEGNQIVR